MKKIKFLFLLIVLHHFSFAQTGQEWTQQKKLKKQYLLQQVAALKVYAEYAQKGYGIVADGLKTIGNIKQGDFNLHDDFFGRLQNINTRIRNSEKVAEVISNQLRIVKISRQTIAHIKDARQYDNKEFDYCKTVFDRLVVDCLQTMEELVLVFTSFQMTDDERIGRIDQLHLAMQNKYEFAASFSDDVILLAMQRRQEGVEVEYGSELHTIK